MVISLIKQAEDNLINFQAVAKERLSKFKLLLKCAVKFSNSSYRQTS